MAKRAPIGLLVGVVSILCVAFIWSGCPETQQPNECGPSGCDGDADSDTDVDTDSDSDSDGDQETLPDSDHDLDSDGEPDAESSTDDGDADRDDELLPPRTTVCDRAEECVLSLTFHMCCPCPEARHRSIVLGDECILEATASATSPAGCASGCEAIECEPCVAPNGVVCEEAACRTTYPGECAVDRDCGDGQICDLVDGSSRCVPDPNECRETGDCPPGAICSDWYGMGYLTCWNPASGCRSDDECSYNEFCEDPEDDGVFSCINRSPACRLGHEADECGAAQSCVDPDGDGYGECVDG
jgi:hypothetical protein